MNIRHGDCLEVMAAMEPESVDAIVTDPPYGLEFMGKEWDALAPRSRNPNLSARLKAERKSGGEFGERIGTAYGTPTRVPRCRKCGKQKFNHPKSRCVCEKPDWDMDGWHHNYGMQQWHERWAVEAYRVAKPSAYLLAFGGTRTVHRMTVALEDAGWIIRDMLVWAYASGFPKSKASLKPAWEPIVMARKPGPLRELAIDACRIATTDTYSYPNGPQGTHFAVGKAPDGVRVEPVESNPAGRWPANVILTDPIFDGGVEGVVGGGETGPAGIAVRHRSSGNTFGSDKAKPPMDDMTYGDSGTYSRFFLIPKADRADREPVLGGLPERRMQVNVGQSVGRSAHGQREDGQQLTAPRQNVHPTVKPTELMRHLVRLVTPSGGLVLDPFLGSGTTGLACELEGFPWVGIEREAEYVAIAEARLNGTQRGFGLTG